MLFKDMNLIEPIQKALNKSGYVKATPIQSESIPLILKSKDLLGIAQTGTGKTAAFTLPILQLMHQKGKSNGAPTTLILAPTRELAAQIGESINEYGSFTNFRHTVIFGGVKQYNQERALSKGVDIVVATPGRLLDLINQKIMKLSSIEFLVLDEADRMLDMGFINDVKKILKKIPQKKQTLLFSATMSTTISQLAKQFLDDHELVEIAPETPTVSKIDQSVYFVGKDNKNKLLQDLIKPKNVKSAIVFTRTKHRANKVSTYLDSKGIKSEAIHGNKSQGQRTAALERFKSGHAKVLVATDIVARGIDIDNISHVINYELPNESESYVHRIGRTARAGTSGTAYSFCSAEEKGYFDDIERLIKKKIPVKSHDMHCDFAQNAKGKDAKPKAKVFQKKERRGFKKSETPFDSKSKKEQFRKKKPKYPSKKKFQSPRD